ncbi:protoheme IX farnesyltransferase [bacterium]|nr:protoheme IX farnesyltransferase [bacterium]
MNLKLISAYLEISKIRIVCLVMFATTMGFFLGGNGISSYSLWILTLLGISLVTGGGAALNHYIERDSDAKMERTKNRPIPSGLIQPSQALMFGITSVLAGLAILVFKVNLLTGFLALLASFLYVLVYTPMKKITWWNTFVGAIPGAIPPMIGWTAATEQIQLGTWVLFAILFVWQHPHFYPLAWILKEDYAKGGLKMLPVVEPDGKSTFRQTIFYLVLLIPVSLLPTFTKMTGDFYFYGALILSLTFLAFGIPLAISKSILHAKRLFAASIFYLPMLLLLIVADFGF